MINFKSHLDESLSSAYTWDTDNIDGDGETIEYQISFRAKSGMYYVMMIAHLKHKVIRIDFSDEDGDSSISGNAGSDSFKVFATLGDILRKGLIQHPGFGIMFEGSNNEPSKVKLYKALAQRAASITHGTVTTQIVSGNTRYTITPKHVSPNRR